MSTLTIADELFERLTRRAAALDVTVEQLVAPDLDRAAAMPSDLPATGGTAVLDAWLKDVEARAGRYPAEFVMDGSRENLYTR